MLLGNAVCHAVHCLWAALMTQVIQGLCVDLRSEGKRGKNAIYLAVQMQEITLNFTVTKCEHVCACSCRSHTSRWHGHEHFFYFLCSDPSG